jgi:hypothetical protein
LSFVLLVDLQTFETSLMKLSFAPWTLKPFFYCVVNQLPFCLILLPDSLIHVVATVVLWVLHHLGCLLSHHRGSMCEGTINQDSLEP